MAIMSIIHVAAVHWSEQKFIIIIRGAHAPGRAVGDVYVYPQYTGFIAICAARSYAVYNGLQSETMIFWRSRKELAVIKHSQLINQ